MDNSYPNKGRNRRYNAGSSNNQHRAGNNSGYQSGNNSGGRSDGRSNGNSGGREYNSGNRSDGNSGGKPSYNTGGGSDSRSNGNSRGNSRGDSGGYFRGRSRRSGGGSGFGNRGRGFGGNRSRGNNRNRGEKIAPERYIAIADEGYVFPSIYVEDKTFNDYNLHASIKQNLKRKGFVKPTKIQDQAIPVILQGTDIMGLASTGSGKTGAFLIPMLDRSINLHDEKFLIIVPTRELAAQIQDEFRDLTQGIGRYSSLVIGGMNMGKQIGQLRRNPEFVIGTPGRLKDLYERRVLDLSKFNNIILDEVDRMLDMGFLPDISFLISKLTTQRHTLFFSATMSSSAEKIADQLLSSPVKILVEPESPLKNVHQDVVRYRSVDDKSRMLLDLLVKNEFSKVLVFSRTKRGADKISKSLNQSGMRVDSIHGDKTQNRRLRVLNDFKTNRIDVLIATDVAARGLDIPNVTHVINYDEPETYKDYIHRIGRTGRAGKPGNALTFVMG